MTSLKRITELPFPRDQVFAWFERPGALVRLNPPFSGTVLAEPDDGLRDGSTSKLGVGAPGVLGVAMGALARAVPWPDAVPERVRRAELDWTARHDGYDPPRSFRDTMVHGPMGRWVHTHRFADARGQSTIMVDEIDFAPPAARWLPARGRELAARPLLSTVQRVLDYRAAQLRDDLAFHAAHATAAPQTVAVSGASGLIGRQLCALLTGGGHRALRLVRRPPTGPDEIPWDPRSGRLDAEALRDVDAVVHLAGRSIGGRFTPRVREEIRSSRITGTLLLARTLEQLATDGRRRALVSASAIGFYGPRPHGRDPDPEPLTEDSPSGAGFLAGVCRAWEETTTPAAHAGVRVVTVRTGLVQSPVEGPLARLLPLFAVGLGGPLDRAAWQSWISLDDVVGIYAHAVLDDAVHGPVNAVGPAPATGAEYARTLGRVLGRPAALTVPAVGPRLVVGTKGASELAYASQRVSAARVERFGYRFRHRTLEESLRHVLP